MITTVDEYIDASPEQAREYARQVRAAILEAVPEAEEKLSYKMPYYAYKGRLMYWGAYQQHIGVYIMGGSRTALAEEIKPYHQSKATLHFKLDEPLPVELIKKLALAQKATNEANKK